MILLLTTDISNCPSGQVQTKLSSCQQFAHVPGVRKAPAALHWKKTNRGVHS